MEHDVSSGALWYLVLAYSIIWILLFAYLFSLAHREQELDRDLKLITQVLRDKKEGWPTVIPEEGEVEVAEAHKAENPEPFRAA